MSPRCQSCHSDPRPKSTTTNITVDLSDDNADSLINHPGVVQITPTTILKNPVGFQKGRTVGVTPGWLAYALSKGESSSRLLIQVASASYQAHPGLDSSCKSLPLPLATSSMWP